MTDVDHFITTHLPTARRVAAKASRGTYQHTHDDIESDAMYGLTKAAHAWTGPGTAPAAWVITIIQRTITDGYRERLGRTKDDEGNYRRAHINSALSLDTPITDDGNATLGDLLRDPSNHAARTEAISDLHPALDRLPWRERRAIALVYFGGYTLLEIANDWGVTESRMSQICTTALARLAADMADTSTED